MGHKCFISFKTEDIKYKRFIQYDMEIDFVDKSLNARIESDDPDYILRKIRSDYLSDSSVTIHLIGNKSNEELGQKEQEFIKRELQASLYNGEGNSRNGILGIVLPSMYEIVYSGEFLCSTCDRKHNGVNINDSTVVREFSRNYYIFSEQCSHAENDRYCVLVTWDDFTTNPEKFIELAFQKREDPIADNVTVYP